MGRDAFHNFILPCWEQALFDTEDFVVHRAVRALTALVDLGLFSKQNTTEVVEKSAPLLVSPAPWVRSQTIMFISAVAKKVGLAHAYAYLLPVIRPFLQPSLSNLVKITEETLTISARAPLTREEFDSAVKSVLEEGKGGAPEPTPEPTSVSSTLLQELTSDLAPLEIAEGDTFTPNSDETEEALRLGLPLHAVGALSLASHPTAPQIG